MKALLLAFLLLLSARDVALFETFRRKAVLLSKVVERNLSTEAESPSQGLPKDVRLLFLSEDERTIVYALESVQKLAFTGKSVESAFVYYRIDRD